MSQSIANTALIGKTYVCGLGCLTHVQGPRSKVSGPRSQVHEASASPHICFSPGKHRSGFFFILVSMFLSEVRGLSGTIHERLKVATGMYYSKHPDFEPGDYNEEMVQDLLDKNLEGHNSGELPGLAARMDDEPLYQQALAKLQEPPQRESSPESTSSSSESEEAPWRRQGPRSRQGRRSEASPRRSRSPVRLVPRPKALIPRSKGAPKALAAAAEAKAAAKAKLKTKAKLTAKAELMPEAKAKVRSEVPGPRSKATSSSTSDVPEDKEEWNERDCWVCACGSMNLRFTQWCACGLQRKWQKGWGWKPAEGDWVCGTCGNINFQWRKWCAWSACSTGDWTCECGNFNWARRRVCNRKTCLKPRPW